MEIMTDYIQSSNLNCNHRKVLLTAKDFTVQTIPTDKYGKPSPVVVCLECKKYELIEFK